LRITAEARKVVRARIVKSASELFTRKGFESTTTRDIAASARIAAGTLFNYFSSKEALAMSFIAEALWQANLEFDHRQAQQPGSVSTLEESLFDYIATGLRHLRAHRPYVAEVLESTLSLFSTAPTCEEADRVRVAHLEAVRHLIAERAIGRSSDFAGVGRNEPSSVTMHLYWTLYLGVLAYWSADESAHQEETLALLDQTVRLFAASLSANHSPLEVNRGA